MKTSKKGISLIVLVITIIVMLILATAIILSLSGSDMRNKANEAVNATDISTAKEVVAVAQSEWELNYDELTEEYDNFGEYANAKLEKAGINNVKVSKDGVVNTKYTDKNGDVAIIPDGFSVSGVTTERTIDDGLVILDKDGNEFVWVPVDDYARFERTTKYKASETITDPGTYYTEPLSKTTDDGITLSLSNDLTGEWKEYTEMRASVEEYKGFYIARYEAGLPEGKTTSTVTSNDKPISKKGATVWNKISWGKSMTEIGTTGAVYRARQMYKGSKSVVSTLCYSVQWDAALQFIATKDSNYPTDSTRKGNYTGSLLTTGYSEDYAVNNIYDMAGNGYEWTMEANSTVCRVLRGGSYVDDGSYDLASSRLNSVPGIANDVFGFRLTLYIK